MKRATLDQSTEPSRPPRLIIPQSLPCHPANSQNEFAGTPAHHPTEPSISSAMRRLSSTPDSSGSSLTIGSTKPRTIMFICPTSLIPPPIREENWFFDTPVAEASLVVLTFCSSIRLAG